MPRGVTVRFMRALVAGNEPPPNLEQGELAIDALDDPPHIWTGVPLPRDPLGRIDLLGRVGVGTGMVVAISSTAPSSPNQGDLWFSSILLMTFIYFNGQWVSIGGGGPPIAPPATITDVNNALAGALVDYALLDSETFTGAPAAPTPPMGMNTTQLATTAFIMDGGFAAFDSQTFIGEPTAPTPPDGNNTTRLATTEFADRAIIAEQYRAAGGHVERLPGGERSAGS